MRNNIFVEKIGNGPDLVLIHGWGVHSGFWKPILDRLANFFCITTIDLPGFGRSPMRMDQPYNLSNLTDQIIAAIPERSILLGWSLGGLIATYIAVAYPHRVEKLICVASTPKFIKAAGWPGIKATLFDRLVATINDASEDTLARFLALQFRNTAISRHNIIPLRKKLFEHGLPNPAALYGGLEIIRDTDLREQVANLQCPAMYILGNQDVLVPTAIAVKINQILCSGYIHILQACHAPFLSNTENFLQVVHHFSAIE